MPKIFVSYRRQDSAAYAGRLCDELARAYGRGSVFLDIDTIRPGDEFADVLEARIRRTRVFLALIGPGWIGACDASGRRRIEDPEDFVRLEIASALARRIPVIPVLLGGAAVPAAEHLPQDLKRLPRMQACEVGDLRFRQDVRHLVRAIDARLGLGARVPLALYRQRYAVTAVLALAVLGYVAFAPRDAARRSLPLAGAPWPEHSEQQPAQAGAASPPLADDPAPSATRAGPFGSGSGNIDAATMALKREIDKLGQIKDILGQSQHAIGTIGVVLTKAPQASGSYVASLIGDGPGHAAGMHAGDVLDALDGKPVNDVHDIELAVMKAPPGSTILVSVRRGARQLAFPVVVGRMGDADIAERDAQIEDRARAVMAQVEKERRGRDSAPAR